MACALVWAMSTLRSLSLGLCLSASMVAVACSSSSSSASSDESNIREADGPHLCVALRGNGNYIITHFASLARLIENYGIIDGMAGGSSSTITMFTYESILKNPTLRTCGDQACSAEETAARAALLLKSLREYGQTVGSTDGFIGDGGVVELVNNVKAAGI